MQIICVYNGNPTSQNNSQWPYFAFGNACFAFEEACFAFEEACFAFEGACFVFEEACFAFEEACFAFESKFQSAQMKLPVADVAYRACMWPCNALKMP